MGNPASNTQDCFREFIGQRVIGVLFNACPPGQYDIAQGTKTFIFEDGRGLTFSSDGSYWIESAQDVSWAIAERRNALEAGNREIAEVLALAVERSPTHD